MTDHHVHPGTAPGPTAAEWRRRSSLPRQLVRFVVLDIEILKLSRQHH